MKNMILMPAATLLLHACLVAGTGGDPAMSVAPKTKRLSRQEQHIIIEEQHMIFPKPQTDAPRSERRNRKDRETIVAFQNKILKPFKHGSRSPSPFRKR